MKTILFAEDDDDNSEMLLETLSMLGYDACRAKSGRELLGFLGHISPDLIILDIKMPELDGIEALQILRQDARFRDLPILALTATALQGDRELFCRQGFSDCMAKPFAIPQLAIMLSKYLSEPAASLPKTQVV